MKIAKIDKGVLIFGILAAVVGFIIHFSSCTAENSQKQTENYPLTTIVTEINSKNDTVSIMDNNGFVWQFYGVEDWEEGDICSVIMNDNGTETIFDDTIVTTRYGGRF